MNASERLGGRRILITGAAAGIGLACARRCVAEGAAVAMADIDGARLAAAREEISDRGAATAVRFDVAERGSVAAGVADAARALGGLDGVVNNAGVAFHHRFDEIDWPEWDRTLAVNLTGPMHVCREALDLLKDERDASIVNVASGAGLRPIPESLAYCASKAGLIMATRSLALELGAHGIRVNAVCPGPVDTEMFRRSLGGAESVEAVRSRNALSRIGAPEDIAAAVAYLLSAEASFVTGTALAVEGGRSFH